ncbi:hypothetical protein CTAYLR_008317 [Chrysophaeum taylorii]|uniref:Hydantoin racemase n=1 Tax=Chrysophaeum taylorii TaxID=2483200 RepID=A0AAD7U9I4_9STRA|nr:hypothetical protein CTAYLR_008317 [Chrysophaeum taylorii]
MHRRILIVNPNTSAAFTARIRASVRSRYAVECVQPHSGPETIESLYDEILSTPPSLELMLNPGRPFDAAVVACFSDHPLTHCARELFECPVVGLLDAACATALLLGDEFAVVTTSPSWVPLLRHGIARLGFKDRCAGIASIDARVKDVLDDDMVAPRVVEQARAAGADVVVLGCAGFSSLRERVEQELPGLVAVDPVSAAIHAVEGLLDQNLRTSKNSLYATPRFKPYITDRQLHEKRLFEAAYDREGVSQLPSAHDSSDDAVLLSYDDYVSPPPPQ